MRYLIILLLVYSCNSSQNDEKILIQKKEVYKLNQINDSLRDELENCKMNYRAIDEATMKE